MKTTADQMIRQALREDNAFRDVTTQLLIDKNKISRAYIVAKENAVLCGLDIAKETFKKLDPRIQIISSYKDGDHISKNKKILTLKGKTRAILSAERVALNFLGHLSGIATLTRQFVTAAGSSRVKIMDTRKTTPGLRSLERLAVRVGGGTSHRDDLAAMVLVKDNHRMAVETDLTIPELLRHLRKKTNKILEIEVDNLVQLKAAIEGRPNIILLDNMTVTQMRQAVALNKRSPKPCLLEASGGINLKNIRNVAKTGVDRISIGALTHSARSTDFSLEFIH